MEPGCLVSLEDEAYALPQDFFSSDIITVDGETGEVQIFGSRTPSPPQASLPIWVFPTVSSQDKEDQQQHYADVFGIVVLLIVAVGLFFSIRAVLLAWASSAAKRELIYMQARQARVELDKALGQDDAIGAQRALDRLRVLEREGGVPRWLPEVVAPLEEENELVEEGEQHRRQLLEKLEAEHSKLDAELTMCQQQDLAGEDGKEFRLLAARAKIKEIVDSGHEIGGMGQDLTSSAEANLKAWHDWIDHFVVAELELLRGILQGPVSVAIPPVTNTPSMSLGRVEEVDESDEETSGGTLLENRSSPIGSGGGGGAGGTATAADVSVERGDSGIMEETSEQEGTLLVAAEAIAQGPGTEGRELVAAAGGGGGGQNNAITPLAVALAALSNPGTDVGLILQSIQIIMARISDLDKLLRNRKQHRVDLQERLSIAAQKDLQGRCRGELKEKVTDLKQARGRHEDERRVADKNRRQRDQTLFTYLLPLSLMVFSISIYLAVSTSSSLLLDALWQIPYRDLLYGCCKNMPKNPKGSASTSSLSTSWLSYYWYLLPTGETALCYVEQTFIMFVGTAFMVLVHHMLGWLQLADIRAKVNVGLLMLYCRSFFVMLTWSSLLSVRFLLVFYALLWTITWFMDEGHAFPRRKLISYAIIPSVSLSLGLYEACRYVNATEPTQGLLLILSKAIEAVSAAVSEVIDEL